jgi:hypothetical protein
MNFQLATTNAWAPNLPRVPRKKARREIGARLQECSVQSEIICACVMTALRESALRPENFRVSVFSSRNSSGEMLV